MIRIYCLIDPRDNKPFYVGATRSSLKSRLAGHIHDSLYFFSQFPSDKNKLIADLLRQGMKPKIFLLRVAWRWDVDHYESFYYRMFVSQGFNMLQEPGNFVYSKSIGPKRKRVLLLDFKITTR